MWNISGTYNNILKLTSWFLFKLSVKVLRCWDQLAKFQHDGYILRQIKIIHIARTNNGLHEQNLWGSLFHIKIIIKVKLQSKINWIEKILYLDLNVDSFVFQIG